MISPPNQQLQPQHARVKTVRKTQRKGPRQLQKSLSSSQPELRTTAIVVEADAVDMTGLEDGPIPDINGGGKGSGSPRDSPRTRQKLEQAKVLDKEVVASQSEGDG